MRLLNLIVIGALVLAAAYVYRIKFDSTVQAERLAKIRGEVRRERDKVAALRDEWSRLDDPVRIEELAKRFLPLKPIAPNQFDSFDRVPDRPPQSASPDSADQIGTIIENSQAPANVTGGIAAQRVPPLADADQTREIEVPAVKTGRLDR